MEVMTMQEITKDDLQILQDSLNGQVVDDKMKKIIITKGDLQTIEDGFLEAAYRANRLREWAVFDGYLQSLDRRVNDYHAEIKKSVESGKDNLIDIVEIWNKINFIEWADLQNFAGGVRWINKSTWESQNGALLPANAVNMKVLNISNLTQTFGEVEKSLKLEALKPLVDPCNLFRKFISVQKSERQQIVNEEIKDLCELTIRLRERIQKM
jgi:hypothetical protein